ncbi:hypothetical protein [Hymenobacter rubripertinctus]|uniref:Uncharacterized protein n=1 Tax=Hymenobacter rubripertinctus TaxID=2029981 RepID=A0A418QZA1_9BACT|nr:hypothetical protein [Hymenobacter rubripertinctus]RIY10482.1 hypothetical protein D0T11_09780 [Hymenobacter rubripertinctus]
MTLFNYLRALALFYRLLLPQTALLSAVVLGATWLGAGLLNTPWPPRLGPGLVLMKLATFPVVAYLGQRLRPEQHWLFRNLHLSPGQLWAPVLVLDTVGFGAFVGLLNQLWA